ncbi:hypothetical protein GGH94_006203 [Coemansia aciculifera]|uniref:Sphingomyelin synthase-like domain-containing protein n=1 Tax=Coemansia aciculifera TaxID=417176 RepID=A0A9W8M3K3_9FUNG|nr:hypothetical protein GGH94_006203 [Coemansia aciculifera]
MLQDVILERLPLLERAWISDKFVGTSVIICIIGGCICARGWRERLMLIRRIGWMVAILYFLRSITISVTTVPPSISSCKIDVPQSTWQVIKATPDILAGNIGQCTDKIFSGHTAILLISFLFWQRYATHWSILVYSALHTFIGILTVLLARYHYTIDVVIGALLTFFVHHLYYSTLDFAIRLRSEHDAQMAVAWSKLSLSEEEAHALFRSSQDDDRVLYYDDNEADRDDGGYKMAVFSRAPPLTGTTEDGSGWRDYDSAVGVDIGRPDRSAGGLLSAVATADDQDMDRQPFVVRKRETSSATATAMSSDTSDADNSGHRRPLSAAAAAAAGALEHHEITVLDPHTTPTGLSRHHRRLPADTLPPMAHLGRPALSGSTMLEIMGVNRPLGSFLPNLVSWMDGLDLRYQSPHQRSNM